MIVFRYLIKISFLSLPNEIKVSVYYFLVYENLNSLFTENFDEVNFLKMGVELGDIFNSAVNSAG